MPLAHRVAYVNDGVTGHASQAVLALRGIFDFANGMFLHLAGKNQRMIVTAATPERRLDSVHVLHVFNRFAIPLVIKGREVMHGALPLVVNVRVASAAGLRIHEELGVDRLVVRRLGGAREHKIICPAAFLFHAQRRRDGIADRVLGVWEAMMIKRDRTVERERRN